MPVIAAKLTIPSGASVSNIIDVRKALGDAFSLALIGETVQTGLSNGVFQVTDALDPTAATGVTWYNLQSAVGTDYGLPAQNKVFNYGQAPLPFTGIRLSATGTASQDTSWRVMKQIIHNLAEALC